MNVVYAGLSCSRRRSGGEWRVTQLQQARSADQDRIAQAGVEPAYCLLQVLGDCIV